jgi:hypothetical protein
MEKIITFLSVSVILSLVACKQAEKKEHQPVEEKFFTKTVANLSFIIPTNCYAYDNREKLISDCRDAIKSDCELIKIPPFTDSITVRVVSTREEMKKYTGLGAGGAISLQQKTVCLLSNEKEGPPIKHELMHMITTSTWGNPDRTSFWMNEGLAAFAENRCNAYNDEQIYRFLLEDKLLLPMDSLAADFYREPDMIAYHQAAFMVEYLLSNYGIEKFKDLWIRGFANFENIYGTSFTRVEISIDSTAKHDYPNAPGIIWKTFSEGCR